MTQIIKAHFDGKVIVPEEPVQLPVGQPLRVHLEVPESEGEMKTRRNEAPLARAKTK